MSTKIRVSVVQFWDTTVGALKKGERTIQDNVREACNMLDEAGDIGSDIVCLPEVVESRATGTNCSEPIPGPVTERYSEKARKYNMYVVGAQFDNRGGITGFLIDRKGKLMGRYYKVHQKPSSPSKNNPYPVFDLDFGRIGIMICRDNHFPEVARILALQGTQLICYPLAGDRRDSTMWQMVARVRAMDNCLYIAAANFQGRSCIIDHLGYVMADAGDTKGVISARIDFNRKPTLIADSPTDREYVGIIPDWRQYLMDWRREDTYKKILKKWKK